MKNHSLKKRIRARMAATGEGYQKAKQALDKEHQAKRALEQAKDADEKPA